MEPKQCPFCESNDSQEYAITDKNRKVQVWCGKCGAEGPLADSMEEATVSWNNRADEASRQEAFDECLFIVDAHIALHRDNGTDATRMPLEAVAHRIRILKDTPCST